MTQRKLSNIFQDRALPKSGPKAVWTDRQDALPLGCGSQDHHKLREYRLQRTFLGDVRVFQCLSGDAKLSPRRKAVRERWSFFGCDPIGKEREVPVREKKGSTELGRNCRWSSIMLEAVTQNMSPCNIRGCRRANSCRQARRILLRQARLRVRRSYTTSWNCEIRCRARQRMKLLLQAFGMWLLQEQASVQELGCKNCIQGGNVVFLANSYQNSCPTNLQPVLAQHTYLWWFLFTSNTFHLKLQGLTMLMCQDCLFC